MFIPNCFYFISFFLTRRNIYFWEWKNFANTSGRLSKPIDVSHRKCPISLILEFPLDKSIINRLNRWNSCLFDNVKEGKQKKKKRKNSTFLVESKQLTSEERKRRRAINVAWAESWRAGRQAWRDVLVPRFPKWSHSRPKVAHSRINNVCILRDDLKPLAVSRTRGRGRSSGHSSSVALPSKPLEF